MPCAIFPFAAPIMAPDIGNIDVTMGAAQLVSENNNSMANILIMLI